MGRRLFVSVDVAPALRDGIVDAQAPFEGLSGVRLTDPTETHVTVQFLGNVDEERLPDVRAAVREGSSSTDPFAVRFGGLGVFPEFEYITVIWLGVPTGGRALARLHDEVGAALADRGLPSEDRTFTPHVTIARMDHAEAKSDVQEIVRTRDPAVGTMRVSAVRLKESVNDTYRTIERVPLS